MEELELFKAKPQSCLHPGVKARLLEGAVEGEDASEITWESPCNSQWFFVCLFVLVLFVFRTLGVEGVFGG